MYHCNPFAGEKYLRLFLIVVREAKSFQDLRIIDGILYLIFQAICVARGLLKDDHEWMKCFEKASLFTFRKSLRALFAT